MTGAMNFLNRKNLGIAYLLLLLLLGGASAAGQFGNMLLQLSGCVIILIYSWRSSYAVPVPRAFKYFLGALALLVLVQFLPLPPSIWSKLPGRAGVADGYSLLGMRAPWLTLSLAPWKSVASLVWWIPALAMFVMMVSDDAPRWTTFARVTGIFAAGTACLGILQRMGGRGYVYESTNYGQGPGLFANSNHQGSFLLLALLLFATQAIAGRQQNKQRRTATNLPWFELAICGLLSLGIAASNSLACQALLLPVCLCIAMIAKPDWRLPVPLLLLAGLALAAAIIGFVLYGPFENDLAALSSVRGISRQEFFLTGIRVAQDFSPLGTGLGSFADMYRWYENPDIVGKTFVNHAHNDLLELLIETGVFGLLALLAFLIWYIPASAQIWAMGAQDRVAMAASAMIGVELVHSLVDYPLRTAALSALTAAACAAVIRRGTSKTRIE
jgi:putative inorganic carbon (hco3(-)) transporter